MNARITTARICGLNGNAHYYKEKGVYTWNVGFADAATSIQKYWILKAGNTEAEVKKYQKKITKKLAEFQIFNGNKVALLFDDTGTVLAIAPIGQDVWFSIKDEKMVKKSFDDYKITSLKVY